MMKEATMKTSAPKLRRGDKVTLVQGDSAWLIRTKEELEAARKADIAEGRFHDDGGEPILYGPYTSFYGAYGEAAVGRTLEVEVTSLRAEWTHWGRKPKGLTTGFCKELNRVVLFKRAV